MAKFTQIGSVSGSTKQNFINAASYDGFKTVPQGQLLGSTRAFPGQPIYTGAKQQG